MNDDTNEQFDEMMRSHYRSELDAQLGKAAVGFAADLKRVRHHETAAAGRRLLIWSVWAAGAIAASVGIVWGVATRMDASKPNVALVPTTIASNDPLPVEQVVERHSVDEGTVLLDDNMPVRCVRQNVTETTTFYDPQSHAQLEVSVPRERTMLIGLHTY